jgi:hypothetical protein
MQGPSKICKLCDFKEWYWASHPSGCPLLVLLVLLVLLLEDGCLLHAKHTLVKEFAPETAALPSSFSPGEA